MTHFLDTLFLIIWDGSERSYGKKFSLVILLFFEKLQLKAVPINLRRFTEHLEWGVSQIVIGIQPPENQRLSGSIRNKS